MKRIALILISLLLLLLMGCGQEEPSTIDLSDYEHPDLVSSISKEECFLCGNRDDHALSTYWGQDNVGLINVNTFEVLPISINKYDLDGQQVKEPQGVLIHEGIATGERNLHAWTDPDRGNSQVDISPGKAIDPEAIGAFLCQGCLDAFCEHYFVRDTPPEIAVVNFSTRELQPLVETCPWFTFDNFAADVDFQDNGGMDLLIYYAPPRFQDAEG